ncbi:hypothetical protein [Tessaracoccus coleopterorum]|uniref:hypothetical protein n=1 Tax=Tessaracoccus coleopterorum TaxID=2714950 RepID=UPI002F911ECC
MSTPTRTAPRLSHARDIARPGFYVKLVLMMLVNAFGIYGILASYGQQEWAVLAFLVVGLIVVDFVYFSKRAIPAKYLVPGLVFLVVFQVYVMLNTAYVAFTNYGDGHNDDKAAAITQIMKTSDRRVEGTPTYPVAVLERNGEIAFAIVLDGEAVAGDAQTPLTPVDATTDGDRVTGVDGATVLTLAEIQERQDEVLGLRVSMTDNPADGWLRTDNASMAYVAKSLLSHDAATDTFTDADGKVYRADPAKGLFVADDGSTLTPGWRVLVGRRTSPACSPTRGWPNPSSRRWCGPSCSRSHRWRPPSRWAWSSPWCSTTPASRAGRSTGLSSSCRTPSRPSSRRWCGVAC